MSLDNTENFWESWSDRLTFVANSLKDCQQISSVFQQCLVSVDRTILISFVALCGENEDCKTANTFSKGISKF